MPENPLYHNIEIKLREDTENELINKVPAADFANKNTSDEPINICFTAPNIISFDYKKLSIISYTSALHIKPELYTHHSTNTDSKELLDKTLNILTKPIVQEITTDVTQGYDNIIKAMTLGQKISSEKIFPIDNTFHYRKHLVKTSNNNSPEFVIDDFFINGEGIATNHHIIQHTDTHMSKSLFSLALETNSRLSLKIIKGTAKTYHGYDSGPKCIAEKSLGEALENLIRVHSKILYAEEKKLQITD
jgi:hypothetical protein